MKHIGPNDENKYLSTTGSFKIHFAKWVIEPNTLEQTRQSKALKSNTGMDDGYGEYKYLA
jgi:hypothetical protein